DFLAWDKIRPAERKDCRESLSGELKQLQRRRETPPTCDEAEPILSAFPQQRTQKYILGDRYATTCRRHTYAVPISW
ncbi:hypothetical protein J6590_007981, partial [Homalodisca vitripennis]